jgi:chromosomal replication initiator protein
MNIHQAWNNLIGNLQAEMTKAAFDTWVRDTELVEYKDKVLTIGVQNAYARDWLESRLSSTIIRLLTGYLNEIVDLKIIVWHNDSGLPADGSQIDNETVANPTSNENPQQPSSINAKYTFSNFVIGSSNRLASAACMAVAEKPAKAYNPLFLYGGVGMGKTHMLHAIGNSILANGKQVLYVSTEEFTNDLINAIRSHNTQVFRDRYRNIDVLLIDDIQFISGKESTQEEFFHTFNALHGQDKQIVISSDRPPKAMNTLEARLRSRFEWGLIVDIQPPDLETRTAILRSKAKRNGENVPNEILDSIARQIRSNIRELEGALTRVLAFAELTNQPLTLNLVDSALIDLLPKREQLKPDQVLSTVANAFGITPEKILSRDRTRDIALPRQVVMYLLREEANISLPQIGEALGGRDHTTVMYACEKVADMIERDDHLRRQLIQIRNQLYGRQAMAV